MSRVTELQSALSEGWLGYCVKLLDELGISEDAFRNAIKKRALEGISLAFWTGLVEHAEREAVTVQDIGKGLSFGRATYNRWIAQTSVPKADKFFAALVLFLRKDIKAIDLPNNEEATRSAASRTVCSIHEEECGQPRAKISPEEWRCVREFISRPGSYSFVAKKSSRLDNAEPPGSPAEIDNAVSDAETKLIQNLLETHIRSGRARAITQTKTLVTTCVEWSGPIALFLFGLPSGWEALDVD